jgi:hypothetical protein
MELVAWERRINSKLSAVQRAGCASVTYKDRFALILGGRFHDTFYLDCWSYDTTTGAINELSAGPRNCHPRAYHTATLIDGVVWVIGGSDDDAIHCDDPVWCFDVKTRVWMQPKLKGNRTLLRRTAHGACLHPTLPGCILLFGGYGIIDLDQSNANGDVSLEAEWLSDLVLVNTRTNTVESVSYKGKSPIPRAYHSFSAVGNLCIALFGRTENKNLVPAKKAVAVYDALLGTWLEIPEKDIKGTIPQVRSSHRACSVLANNSGGGGGGGSTRSGSGRLGGGVLIFGGAPALASKKVDRLADMHYLKMSTAPIPAPPPQANNRRGGANGGATSSSTSSSKYQFEWINCGDGQTEVGDDTWPIGRGAHAQEYINGKLCLFGGYCRHEKYCTDVWEGLVVVEEAQKEQLESVEIAPKRGGAVCNDPTTKATGGGGDGKSGGGGTETFKWKSTRGRGEPDNIPQNILPTSGKRQRGAATGDPAAAAGGGAAKTSNPSKPVPVGSKRMKKQFIEEVIVTEGPQTVSPEIVPGSRRISALEREVKSLRDALVVQRSKEAALLREANTFKSEAFNLKEELKKADENWRKTAAERDDLKFKFNDQQKLAVKAVAEKNIAYAEATGAEQRCQDAVRRSKASNSIADQKQKALDAAAAQNAQLQTNNIALQGALDQAGKETDKERQLRISIQEQNSVLQVKMATAETEKSELQRQIQISRTSVESMKMQWEGEQQRLRLELSTTKTALSARERENEAASRKESKLASEISTLQDKNTVLQNKVHELESELRSVKEAKDRAEAENSKLKEDMHRLQQEMDDRQRNVDQELDAVHRAIQRARDLNTASGSRRR